MKPDVLTVDSDRAKREQPTHLEHGCSQVKLKKKPLRVVRPDEEGIC